MTSKLTRGPLFAEVHNVPDDYHFTAEELDRIIAGDLFTPRQGAIMARELQERRKADSEPVAYIGERMLGDLTEGYRSCGRVWSFIKDELSGESRIPLYRHAQQPVVPPMQHWEELCREHPDMSIGDAIIRAAWWNHCRAAMLQAQSDDDGEPTDDERIMAIEGIHNCERCGDEGWVMGEMGITRCACGQAGNSPVIPDGYVMVPMRLTAENGAKGALSGEFSETKFINCPECFGDDECETCDGSGRIEITVPVTWTTIKEIWAKGVEHFAAAPQEVK
ncbi:hypothetical protein [Klebsiella michiganensis]|uniref:hypothetical protein n=1 Tax=Klebsiella michiganensis TaxID=1134687 RepID=UPI0025423F34|nr:hypothetical protein [Klebsiella michiganensis]MDK3052091.1 hypothetical protein [Klebsiella michiganensis]